MFRFIPGPQKLRKSSISRYVTCRSCTLRTSTKTSELFFPQQPLRVKSSRLLAFAVLFNALCALSYASGDLNGYHLRGCVINQVPYTTPDKSSSFNFSGVAITYFERLQEDLNFTTELKEWEGSWHSLIDTMSMCDSRVGLHHSVRLNNPCECDIGIGPFSITNDRMKKVDFVWPFGSEQYHLVTLKSNLYTSALKDRLFFFKPFTWQAWLIICAIIALHFVGTLCFYPYFSCELNETTEARNTRIHQGLSTLNHFLAAIQYSYAHLHGSPFESEREQEILPNHRTAWTLLGLTTGFFLTAIYEASLTALLFESKKPSQLQNLGDLTACGVSPKKIAMINESQSRDFWNLKINTTDNRDNCEWGTAGFTVKDFGEGFECVRNGTADYFYDLESSILFHSYQNCDLFEPVGESFFSTSIGFFLPKCKTSAQRFLLSTLSEKTRLLREGDVYLPAKVEALRNECSPDVEITISVERLCSFFGVYLIFFILIALNK